MKTWLGSQKTGSSATGAHIPCGISSWSDNWLSPLNGASAVQLATDPTSLFTHVCYLSGLVVI